MEGNIISSLLGTLERANQGAHTSVKWDASTNMGPQNNVVHENILLPWRFCLFYLSLSIRCGRSGNLWSVSSLAFRDFISPDVM